MTARSWRAPLLVIFLVTVFSGVRASHSHEVPGDFLRYHRGGRLVATGRADKLYDLEFLATASVYAQEREADARERGDEADPLPERTFKYLPATAVMLAPLGALHPATANILWGAWNGFLISLLFVAGWKFCAPGLSARWMWLPCLVLARAANDNLNLGQLNPTALVPATVALVLLSRRRDVGAGLLLGFGAVVKFMPGFLALWLLWKRRWRAVGFMLLGVVALGWGLPAVVLGPVRSTELLVEYVEVRAHHYTSTDKRDLPGQSMKSFVYRTLGTVPFVKGPDRRRIRRYVSVTELPSGVLYWLVMALNVGVVVWVARATRGPLRAPEDPCGPPEAALATSALLLVSPEARDPHFLYLSLAAVALTYSLVRGRRRGDEPGAGRWRVALVLGVLGAVLLQTSSTTLLGKQTASWFSALCSMGWAALAWSVALTLLIPGLRPHSLPDRHNPNR